MEVHLCEQEGDEGSAEHTHLQNEGGGGVISYSQSVVCWLRSGELTICLPSELI